MTEEDTLKSLIRETTNLLRELILEQGRKLDAIEQNFLLAKQNERDIVSLSEKVDKLDTRLVTFCDMVTKDSAAKEYLLQGEARGYQERKDLIAKIFDIGVKLAGLGALVAFIIERAK